MPLIRSSIVIAAGLACFASAGRAQSIDEALRLYEKRDYDDAAFAFYDVLRHDANPDRRDLAEIYLAETLRRTGFLVPACFYYSDLAKAGRTTRYALNAVEGLLAVQRELHDPVLVAKLLDELYEPDVFGQLSPDAIAQINYLTGELSFRRGKNRDAAALLGSIPPESPLYPKARYLLGILEVRKQDPAGATAHFIAAINALDAKTATAEAARVRNLAILAAARNLYGLGRYEESSKYYEQVPRFSEAWFTAVYENAWAYFRQNEYGKALGELQSVTTPYFAKRHVPEAYVIQATSYFANCQWDRVRRAVARYKEVYEPMLAGLKTYLQKNREWPAFYRDVTTGAAGRYSIELAREVRRARRFKDFHYMLTHLDWERDELGRIDTWRGSQLGSDIGTILDEHRAGIETVAGKWSKRRLMGLQEQLRNFQAQIDILDFEVADAERQWLEQGKEISKGRRARLPRPNIPNDQWQHWEFDKEYWLDELGYIEHSLRSECY